MALSIEELYPLMEEQRDNMVKDGLNFDLVGSIGGNPEEMGLFFSDYFDAELIKLESTGINGGLKKLAILPERLSRKMPDIMRRPLASFYRLLSERLARTYPDPSETDLYFRKRTESILLVDDNSLTGRTLEFWKDAIGKRTTGDIATFVISRVGDYKPNYYCIGGWRSFEWRPIGT